MQFLTDKSNHFNNISYSYYFNSNYDNKYYNQKLGSDDMDNDKKEPSSSDISYEKLLKKILLNQKKSQNLSITIIVLLLAIIVIKLFVTG